MIKHLNVREEASAIISCGAVEAETISKTRASLKSQKSKGNNFNLYKMRKVFLTLVTLIGLGISANAQDIILKKDGSEIKAKVLEITEQQVKYKDFDFQNGPIRNINIFDVFMITYENGQKEVFNKQTSTPTFTILILVTFTIAYGYGYPHFSIYAMPSAIMDTLVNAYPTIFYVKEGYIRQVIVGELPCSYFFRKIIQSKLNQKKKINNN